MRQKCDTNSIRAARAVIYGLFCNYALDWFKSCVIYKIICDEKLSFPPSLLNQPQNSDPLHHHLLSPPFHATIFHGDDKEEEVSKEVLFGNEWQARNVPRHWLCILFNKLSQLLSLLSDEKRDSSERGVLNRRKDADFNLLENKVDSTKFTVIVSISNKKHFEY